MKIMKKFMVISQAFMSAMKQKQEMRLENKEIDCALEVYEFMPMPK